MRYMHLVRRGAAVAWSTAVCWFAVPGTTFAEGGEGGGSYVPSYALALLAIALGVMLTCRSSRRRERARPEQYQESSLGGKDNR
jgi:hypothetical protein